MLAHNALMACSHCYTQGKKAANSMATIFPSDQFQQRNSDSFIDDGKIAEGFEEVYNGHKG